MLRAHLLLGAAASSLVLCPTPSPAQASSADATADSSATRQPPDGGGEIVVTGYRYLDADTSGITNLPLPIEEVPQSISLLNNDFAEAADIKNSAEVAQYTPGAEWASYSPSYGNQIFLRGFAANYAIDGLLTGDQITEPDPAVLQRYEIVKGPASVVYGAQSPGGVINLVQKDASPGTPSYVQALGGSFKRWRLEGQVAGALNASGTIRAIGVAAREQGGSFVDFVHLSRTVVYSGLDFDLSPTLTAYVRGSYQRTADTPFNGLPTFPNGTIVPLPRSFYLGRSDFNNVTQAERADTGLAWRPDALWSLDVKAVYQHTTHAGGNAYNYDYIAYDGSFPVGGENFRVWHVDDVTIAGEATRKLDDIGLRGSYLVASVRYQHYRYFIDEGNFTGGTANVFAGDRAVADVFNSLQPTPGGYEQDQRENFLTASAQAVIKVLDPLTLVGGISYSDPRIRQQVYDGSFESFNPGHQISYRAAAILEPARGLNLYASYSESYQPNLRIDVNRDVLPPVKGKQYEVGAKYAPVPQFLLTAALFQIDERNVAVYDTMVDGEALYRASGVRHHGLELEATGQIARAWQIKGGVALLDPKVTNDPTNPVNDGETRPWLPKVTADLFTSYEFANGLSVSGGLRHAGSVRTYDRSSAFPTPDLKPYTLFDAGLGYTFGKWHAQANLKNLADKHYYVGTPIFQSLSAGLLPGEPRSFSVSLRREF